MTILPYCFSIGFFLLCKKEDERLNIGVDIEEINRFENKPQEFIDRVFTENEQKYCLSKTLPAGHFAVRFCAKEAVVKALNSMGIKHPRLNQIEVYHNQDSCPKIRLPKEEQFDNLKIEVSLSHDRTKAIAFVVISHF